MGKRAPRVEGIADPSGEGEESKTCDEWAAVGALARGEEGDGQQSVREAESLSFCYFRGSDPCTFCDVLACVRERKGWYPVGRC